MDNIPKWYLSVTLVLGFLFVTNLNCHTCKKHMDKYKSDVLCNPCTKSFSFISNLKCHTYKKHMEKIPK